MATASLTLSKLPFLRESECEYPNYKIKLPHTAYNNFLNEPIQTSFKNLLRSLCSNHNTTPRSILFSENEPFVVFLINKLWTFLPKTSKNDKIKTV